MSIPYLPHRLHLSIDQVSRQFPVVMLTGPRQVGKTTLLEAHFSVLEKSSLATGHGAVICLCAERLPLTAHVDAIPVWQVGG